MLEMTKPNNQTGKVVPMDSGFCVSVGIFTMHSHGVCGQSLIKKKRYCPPNILGDLIVYYFIEGT